MRQKFQTGFTIIEVILFLAVAGVMLSAVIVGAGTSLGTQRYRDSVTSLQSYLQDQYFEVSNVRNQLRTEKLTCAADGTVSFGSALSQNRGRSTCVIMGRYITIGSSSNKLAVYPVIGIKNSTVYGTDLEIFKSYTLKTIPQLVEDFTVDWGSNMLNDSFAAAAFTILILQSPSSGSVRTFIKLSNNAVINQSELLNDAALARSLLICVDDVNTITSGMMGVKVNAGAANGSAIEIIGSAVSKASGGCS